MGCGHSKVQTVEKKSNRSKSTTDELNYEAIMDKKIPNYFIEENNPNAIAESHTEEEGRVDTKNDTAISKSRNVKKGIKVRGREDVEGEIYENMTKIEKKKKQDEIIFVVGVLKGHFVFYNLAESELEYVVKNMFYCEVDENQYIFKQGDNASSYFILQKGSAEVIINDEVKRTLKNGAAFGEYALLYNAPRSASIRTLEKCYLWGIDRSSFRKSVEELSSKEYEENRKFITTIPFFESMTDDQKNACCSVILTHKFVAGDHIVNEGDDASSFYIIKSGNVSVTKGNKEIRKLGKGDSFGEQALYINTKRGATVTALDEVRCLALGRDTLQNILGDKIQKIIYRNIQKWAFDKSELLSQLTNIQKQKIIENMTIKNFKAGTVIMTKGDVCNQIVIVIEGSLKKGVVSQITNKGFAYGDAHLAKKNQSLKLDGDLIMETDGVLATIDFFKFFSYLGGSIEDIIEQNKFSHEKEMFKNREKNDFSNILISNLIFIKKLGFGQFGAVFLVKDKTSNNLYALKCVAKNQVLEQTLQKHLLQEKDVLEKVGFPFIMQFYRCFKDDNYIYFLLEFVKGMELFDVIRDIGILNTSEAQFYIGSLILSLEYLNSQSIIYRDIKPENIMVNSKGYLKMIDMGTAKVLNSSKGPARTFTIIGTPHYMAPEIITGKGYTFNVDLWSIGICLYEFICGYVPFAEDAEDPYEIYEEIIKNEIKFPGFLKDKKGKKIIMQLLNKVPDARLGGSYASLKANPWFDGFDWDRLFRGQMNVPYVPPMDKMIKDAAIKAMERESKPILEEVLTEQKVQGKKKIPVKDPDWDKPYEC